jgi:hypothetical protein
MMAAHRVLLLFALGLLGLQGPVHAQLPREAPPPKDPPAWASELPGYWESVIAQNWRWRMVTPPKGDYVGIPLNAAAKAIADLWDPARDTAQGEQCKSYGAATVMMLPEHLHISWQDQKTLKMDVDTGMQSRVFHFESSSGAESAASWQGESVASWQLRRSFGARPPESTNARYLQVNTTHMLPGYLRKNGVPYSANAALSEYYDLIHAPEGEVWLIVTTTVTDPTYLDYPLLLTAQFRKLPDGTHWDPTPCSATW